MYPYTQLEHIRKVLQACTTASSGLAQTGAPDLSLVLEARKLSSKPARYLGAVVTHHSIHLLPPSPQAG
jgi:hypothetical protein